MQFVKYTFVIGDPFVKTWGLEIFLLYSTYISETLGSAKIRSRKHKFIYRELP